MGDVFRDDRVHVMREKCSTCIFRPGNLMKLRRGVVKIMHESAVDSDGVIYCHKTLAGKSAVCRGQFDARKTPLLELAERLGMISWQEEPNGKDLEGKR